MTKLRFVAPLLLLLSGCMVGPNYKRPEIAVPEAYRSAPAAQEGSAPASLADESLTQLFPDKQLEDLIHQALQNNFDLRIAAARVAQAQAQLGITRADQFPEVSAGADIGSVRSRPVSTEAPVRTTEGSVQLFAAWNLDFWGKYRRASEASRAELLATEWARQEVVRALVSDLAASYFQLRELDLELEIAQRTLASRQESLKLIQILTDRGLRSMLDVRQAEQLVYGAGLTIPFLQKRIEQEENQIRTLLGQYPGEIGRGEKLLDIIHPPDVPSGLPSSMLARRPDIQQAEQQLIAFNARIGVAKAAYFPQISLTASGGYRSSDLAALLTGPSGIWNFAASLTQPIFAGGRIKNNVKFTEAQRDEAVLVYERTIQQAFREVSDALIAYQKNQEFRAQEELLTRSAQDALKLAEDRYQAGATSYLEVLDSNTRAFAAEIGLAQAHLNELLALVDLYRALGGGWQQPQPTGDSPQPAAGR